VNKTIKKPVAVVFMPWVPNPQSSAGCLRIHELLNQLSYRFDVYLLTGCPESSVNDNIERHYIVTANVNRKKLLWFSIRHRPKLVLYEFWWVAEKFFPVGKFLWPGATHVFDCLDIDHLRRTDLSDVDLHELRNRELAVVYSFSYVLFVSVNDAEYFKSRLQLSVQSFVYPVPFSGKDPVDYDTSSKVLLFIGNLDQPSNKDGIEWFINTCMADLILRLSEIKLTVVGKGSENLIVSESMKDNVELMGRVVDVRGEYMRSVISIAPVFSGAGCNGKVVEAMGFGIPVVGTRIAAAGLGANAETDMKVISGSKDTVDSITYLLGNPVELLRLRSAGLRLVEEKFSKRIISSTVDWLARIS
jgi:glycosyltransferase involved in cell wall biosynthesis